MASILAISRPRPEDAPVTRTQRSRNSIDFIGCPASASTRSRQRAGLRGMLTRGQRRGVLRRRRCVRRGRRWRCRRRWARSWEPCAITQETRPNRRPWSEDDWHAHCLCEDQVTSPSFPLGAGQPARSAAAQRARRQALSRAVFRRSERPSEVIMNPGLAPTTRKKPSATASAVLTRGAAREMARVFVAGSPVAPFSVGSGGDWCVTADGVEAQHFYLCFDGQTLFAASARGGPMSALFGKRLSASWSELPDGYVLTF